MSLNNMMHSMNEKETIIYPDMNCIEIAPRALLMAAAVMLSVLLVSIMISVFLLCQNMQQQHVLLNHL